MMYRMVIDICTQYYINVLSVNTYHVNVKFNGGWWSPVRAGLAARRACACAPLTRRTFATTDLVTQTVSIFINFYPFTTWNERTLR